MKRSLFLVPFFLLAGCAAGGSTPTTSQPVVPSPAPIAQAPAEAPKPAVPQAPAEQSGANAFVSVSSGGYLVGPSGMTLYVFAKDTSGVSACYDKCVANWPILESQGPVTGSGTTGTFSVIARTDGKSQVAYNGMSLYYWVNDKAPGDTTGNGVGGVWSLAKP